MDYGITIRTAASFAEAVARAEKSAHVSGVSNLVMYWATDVTAQLCLEPPAQTGHLPDTLPAPECAVPPGWLS